MGELFLTLLSSRTVQEDTSMDRAASAGFEGIAQMLLEQKKLMDALEAENRELRRQLADLRRGIGIAIVIEGKTIQLANESNTSNNTNAAGIQSLSPQAQAALSTLQSLQANNGSTTRSPAQENNAKQNSIPSNGNRNGNALADSFVL